MQQYETFLQNYRVTAVSEPSELKRSKISGSRDAETVFRKFWPDDIEYRERAMVLFMNRAFNTIGIAELSAGGTAGTVVDIKQLAKLSIDIGAHGVILCHNHPSGNLKPSEQDISLTNKCRRALELLDVTLHDHLILTAESYYSLADGGDF